MSIFPTPPTPPTPEKRLATQIDNQLRAAAAAKLNAYTVIRKLLYENSGGMTPEQGYAAFSGNTETGLTADQLKASAMTTKAEINLFAPGTINDDVPEATITLPSVT